MLRVLALSGLAAVFVLAACAPQTLPSQVLPTFIAPATTSEVTPSEATPNEAYPTNLAPQSAATQSVSGFTVIMQRAWRDGKQVNADVCFTLPDASDWTIWDAVLTYGDQTTNEFSSAFVSRQDASGGQPAQRCDQLSFFVPPDADLSAAQLSINSLGAYPSNEDFCSLYMPKIQQAMDSRGTGIKLNCVDVNGTPAMQIVSKPADMTQDQAEQMVYSDEFYTVKGPWTFPLSFTP